MNLYAGKILIVNLTDKSISTEPLRKEWLKEYWGCWGGDPACVKECEPGALVYPEAEKKVLKLRGVQMKQRIESGSPEEKRHQLGLNLLAEAREDDIG